MYSVVELYIKNSEFPIDKDLYLLYHSFKRNSTFLNIIMKGDFA